MKEVAFVALAIVISSHAWAADPFILNVSGNNFSTAEPAAIGENLNVAGMLSQVQGSSPVALPGIGDWSTEYTMYVSGLTLASGPTEFVRNFNGGTIEIWADSPNSPWTPTTAVPSIPAYDAGVIPSTLTDGNLFLRGQFQAFTILDFTLFGSDTGTITGTDLDWVAGSALGEMISQGIQHDWSWNGFYDVSAPTPPGYQHVYGGKLERVVPTPVEPSTWGSIKAVWSTQ